VGLKDGGDTMILVLVEGRQDPIFGMKISQLANLMESLGCEYAMELDGGGSSTMVIDGDRVSGRPDNEPSERAVANHLAILYDEDLATTGELVGFVREGDIQNDDAPIAGATITLSTGQTATTNPDGLYRFDEVAPGSITVTATKDGYVTATDTKDVVVGITNWKSFALVPTPPGEGEGEGEGEEGEGEGEEGEGEGEGEGEEGEGEGEGEEGEEGEGEGEGEEGEGEGEGEDEEAPPASSLDNEGGGCAATAAPSHALSFAALALALVRLRRRGARA
jgi:hypothetical protein